jgi:hypothetical protein
LSDRVRRQQLNLAVRLIESIVDTIVPTPVSFARALAIRIFLFAIEGSKDLVVTKRGRRGF